MFLTMGQGKKKLKTTESQGVALNFRITANFLFYGMFSTMSRASFHTKSFSSNNLWIKYYVFFPNFTNPSNAYGLVYQSDSPLILS